MLLPIMAVTERGERDSGVPNVRGEGVARVVWDVLRWPPSEPRRPRTLRAAARRLLFVPPSFFSPAPLVVGLALLVLADALVIGSFWARVAVLIGHDSSPCDG